MDNWIDEILIAVLSAIHSSIHLVLKKCHANRCGSMTFLFTKKHFTFRGYRFTLNSDEKN